MEKTKRPPMTPKEDELFRYLLRYHPKQIPSQSALAAVFGVHQTYISQLIARLTTKGYITKKSTELAASGKNGKAGK